MEKLTRLDKYACKSLTKLAVSALNEALAREGIGVVVTSEGGRFTPETLRLKMLFSVKDVGGTGKSAAEVEYARYCTRYGLHPSSFGGGFGNNGTTYTIIGWSAKSKKYKVLAQDKYGHKVRFSPDFVKLLLGGHALNPHIK